jgi:hypothetical protein
MALIRVRFSPGLFQEQDFPESNLITAVNMGKNCSSVVLNSAGAVLSGLRATLGNPDTGAKSNPGLKRIGLRAIFKKLHIENDN